MAGTPRSVQTEDNAEGWGTGMPSQKRWSDVATFLVVVTAPFRVNDTPEFVAGWI